jgi:selenocysteine-specific elongation factor
LLSSREVTALGAKPPRFVPSGRLEELATAARKELDQRLAGQEVSAGIPARDFAASLLPKSALGLAETFLEELRARGAIELSRGRVVPAGSEHHMTAAGEDLTRRIEALYREAGLDAPSPGDTAARLDARPATVDGICRFLVTRGRLVRLDDKLLVHRAVLDEVARDLLSWEAETFGVGEFKERFGISRKFAIPILEWLDSERVTVRQGNQRKIIRRG